MVVEVAQRVYSGRKGYEVVVSPFLDGNSRGDGVAPPDTLPSIFYHTYWCVHCVSRNYVYEEYWL